MKKTRIIAVMAALIVSLSGCANTGNPHMIGISSQKTVSSEIIQSTKPEESSAASVSESKESLEESIPTVKAETAQTEVSAPTAESSGAESQTPPSVDESTAPEHEPPKAIQPESAMPQSTMSPAEEPPKNEPPQESEPPIEEELAAPAFHIQTWIDYATKYAGSMGLNVSPDAADCWDNPITAGSHSLYLERDIQSRLNRYSRDGEITDVWVWAEERSDGSYDLYIGYA